MAENTTSKRGRKTTATTTATENTTNVENVNTDMSQILAQMQAQMAKMQQELEEAKRAKDEAVGQNLDLQTLVDALKASNGNGGVDGNLPNYVTVISLVPNIYNLSTEPDGKGTCYSFAELGESKIVSLANVQKIMAVSKYRKQAEEGYFYIVEDGVNDYFRLNQANTTAEDIKSIIALSSDECVSKFVALDVKLQEAIADKIALDIADGKKIDKNRVAEILERTGIDIEEKSRMLKKIMNK